MPAPRKIPAPSPLAAPRAAHRSGTACRSDEAPTNAPDPATALYIRNSAGHTAITPANPAALAPHQKLPTPYPTIQKKINLDSSLVAIKALNKLKTQYTSCETDMHPPLFAHSKILYLQLAQYFCCLFGFLYLQLAQRFVQIPALKRRRLALKSAKNNRLEERKTDSIKLRLVTIH